MAVPAWIATVGRSALSIATGKAVEKSMDGYDSNEKTTVITFIIIAAASLFLSIIITISLSPFSWLIGFFTNGLSSELINEMHSIMTKTYPSFYEQGAELALPFPKGYSYKAELEAENIIYFVVEKADGENYVEILAPANSVISKLGSDENGRFIELTIHDIHTKKSYKLIYSGLAWLYCIDRQELEAGRRIAQAKGDNIKIELVGDYENLTIADLFVPHLANKEDGGL